MTHTASRPQSGSSLPVTVTNIPKNVEDEELGCCGCSGCRESCFIYLIIAIFAAFFLVLVIINHWFALMGLLAILPAAVFLYFMYWMKHRDKVRVGRVIKFYLYGILGAIPSVLIETLLHKLFLMAFMSSGNVVVRGIFFSFFEAFIVASLIEEVMKYCLVQYCPGHQGVSHPYGVVIVATSGALGFATLENVSYVLTSSKQVHEQFLTAIFRALLAVPLHGATGMMIGAKLARRSHFNEVIPFYVVLAIPFFLHGLYDFLLIAPATIDDSTFGIVGFAIACFLVLLGCVYAHFLARDILKQAPSSESTPILSGGPGSTTYTSRSNNL
eukprot:GILJ01005089.1.p1 GENE.GILJ01005089.1~~GILJ01005089.1.p1  ORF type:complete len:328 (-),score=44.20 GILJ01005089.1:165-1148(-)